MRLEVECVEKGEPVVHIVTPFHMSIENLKKLWESCRRYPTLFGIRATKDFGEFCSIFVHYEKNGDLGGNGYLWMVDDFGGLFYMNEIYHPDDAEVHFTFFDGRINGREPLVRAMLKYVFEEYGFRRLSAKIPLYALPRNYKQLTSSGKSPTEFGFFGFVKNCGFKQEGRKRQCSEYKGEYFDVILYGILKEEVCGSQG